MTSGQYDASSLFNHQPFSQNLASLWCHVRRFAVISHARKKEYLCLWCVEKSYHQNQMQMRKKCTLPNTFKPSNTCKQWLFSLHKVRQTYLKINNTTHRHSTSLLTDAQHSRLVQVPYENLMNLSTNMHTCVLADSSNLILKYTYSTDKKYPSALFFAIFASGGG